MDALIIAAKSGIEIKLLIPRKSDSIDNDIQQSGEINIYQINVQVADIMCFID